MLSIKNLKASIEDGTQILKGINLEVKPGEVHAIMGPNGSGKSTLSKVIMGHPAYKVDEGSVELDGKNLLEMEISERANSGLFISTQYPTEIPGVNNVEFLKMALNSKRAYLGLPEIGDEEFKKLIDEKMELLEMDERYRDRGVNEGYSGGEKKRNEILQMAILDPKAREGGHPRDALPEAPGLHQAHLRARAAPREDYPFRRARTRPEARRTGLRLDRGEVMDALSRIKQLGMPRRNDELWTFFPVAKVLAPEFPDACACEEDFSKENDFAALLPIACNARTLERTIADNESEMALLKCNNDFGRTVLNIGKNAKASFEILDNKVLHSVSAERFDIHVGEGADVEIFFANPANDLPLQFRHFTIEQAAGSSVRFSSIERGNGISRVSLDCHLRGAGAHFEIRTLNILAGTSESHHRLHIYHDSPETTSVQFSRNLLDGNSRASYDGSVVVGDGCTKANSSQLVNTILLSEDSAVSVKPVLKIYHDDVECTHGNTVGELDAEQMFYLVSRGIPPEKAKMMLISSFARELFYPLPDSPAKKRLLQVLE